MDIVAVQQVDIIVIQKILTDAIKEYELSGNVPNEVLVTLVSADMYRKLSTKASPAPKPPARRNAALGDGAGA